MRKIEISMHINFSGDSTEFQYPVYRSTDGYRTRARKPIA